MKTKQKHTPEFAAIPNDANDKRAPGSYKISVLWNDEKDACPQKYAQEIYKKSHAEHIAACLNACEGIDPAAVPDLLEASIEMLDVLRQHFHVASMRPSKAAAFNPAYAKLEAIAKADPK